MTIYKVQRAEFSKLEGGIDRVSFPDPKKYRRTCPVTYEVEWISKKSILGTKNVLFFALREPKADLPDFDPLIKVTPGKVEKT